MAELEIDAPDVIGLAVQQRRVVAMERRIEPEPALRRKVRRHVNIGDEETVVKHLAFALHAEHGADRALRAVGDDEPVGVHAIFPVRGRHGERNPVGVRRHADDAVAPAQVDLRQLGRPFNQELLDVVLLQVDERRPMVSGLGQQVELVHLFAAKEHAADTPAHAFLHQPFGAAEPIEDFECAL